MLSNPLIATALFALLFLSLLVSIEYAYKRWELAPEVSRKVAHVLATLFSLTLILFIQNHLFVLILGVGFFILLYTGRKYGLLQSIDSVERHTKGSYLLPLSIYLHFFLARWAGNTLYYVLPILVLAISDPLAALAGTKYAHRTRPIHMMGRVLDKTRIGSLAFFVSTLLLCAVTLWGYGYPMRALLILSLVIATFVTFVEMMSTGGWDNLTIPLGVFTVLWYLN